MHLKEKCLEEVVVWVVDSSEVKSLTWVLHPTSDTKFCISFMCHALFLRRKCGGQMWSPSKLQQLLNIHPHSSYWFGFHGIRVMIKWPYSRKLSDFFFLNMIWKTNLTTRFWGKVQEDSLRLWKRLSLKLHIHWSWQYIITSCLQHLVP